jgi:hypothetical protein
MDITINVNVGSENAEETPDIKIKKSKTKLGRKAVLEMPNDQTQDKPNQILSMMGL